MKMLPVQVIACVSFLFSSAFGFDYDRYKQGDLDDLRKLYKTETAVKVVAPQKLRFQVVLSGYGETCNTGFLKRAMIMAGAPKEILERTPMSKCITVKSAKGAAVSLFIQDKVADYLPREVKLGENIEVFCDFLYIGKTGPGLLVSEFTKPDSSGTFK